MIMRDECTPIAFDEFGRVIGWGPDFNTGLYHIQDPAKPSESPTELR